jgi:hypothetical protein
MADTQKVRVRARVRQTEHGPVLQPAHEETRPKATPVQREHTSHFRVSADTKWERLDRNRRIPILPGRSTVTRTVAPPPPAPQESFSVVWRPDEFYPSEGE